MTESSIQSSSHTHSAAATITISAAAGAAAITLEFHPKHEKHLRETETHYENITH
jgi:hypothetical protein